MALTQVETSGLSGSGASSNSTTGNVFSQTGPFKNRIINGDMRIDQRNAGASVTAATNTAQLDRWKTFFTGNGVFTVQQSSTVPNNTFSKSVVLTVTTPDSGITSGEDYGYIQFIEGYNIADFAWGSASATTITLSFWVRSSVNGTWVASIYNSDGTRCYPATFTISAADTWQKISLTIPGDTGGTWNSTNGIGMAVRIDLGSGSNLNGTANSWNTTGSYAGLRTSGSVNWISNNGATLYLTGVQLEAGTSATQFERRSYGQELALCQRYYQKSYDQATVPGTNTDTGVIVHLCGTNGTAAFYNTVQFGVLMRAAPSITVYDIAGNSGKVYRAANNKTAATLYVSNKNATIGTDDATSALGIYYHYTASAEL